jgi:hypothetical protein
MSTSTPPITERRTRRDLVAPTVVFLATTAVIAAAYWTRGYDSVHDDGIFSQWSLVVVVLVAGTFLAGAVSELPLVIVALGMLTSGPIVVLGRVVADTALHPGSHDLWPLEVVLVWLLSMPPVGVGVVLAAAVRRLSPLRG